MIDKIIETVAKHKANTAGVKKQSSILIPLIERDGMLHLLYEKRALSLKSQPGEICFPGGALEDIEHPMDAAVRETCEELQIRESQIEIIGQIDSILTSFDMLIHCYVGLLHCAFEEIIYSKDEVEAIFTVPMAYLFEHTPKTYLIKSRFDLQDDFPFQSIPNGKDYNFKTMSYPVVFYEYEDYTIWGLTARMTEQFVKMIKSELK
ncbi:MAG TPA: CoA pyrophosphatase [Clostridiales bacterium UBA8960]|nr:CoA pyrophosphatase [Clostridiales bacterium UBA8960]